MAELRFLKEIFTKKMLNTLNLILQSAMSSINLNTLSTLLQIQLWYSIIILYPIGVLIFGGVFMKKAYIDPVKCDRSPACPARRICPAKAISQESKGFFFAGPAVVDESKCTGCGKCVNFCPGQAITMKKN